MSEQEIDDDEYNKMTPEEKEELIEDYFSSKSGTIEENELEFVQEMRIEIAAEKRIRDELVKQIIFHSYPRLERDIQKPHYLFPLGSPQNKDRNVRMFIQHRKKMTEYEQLQFIYRKKSVDSLQRIRRKQIESVAEAAAGAAVEPPTQKGWIPWVSSWFAKKGIKLRRKIKQKKNKKSNKKRLSSRKRSVTK
jgi:hypothetical protein